MPTCAASCAAALRGGLNAQCTMSPSFTVSPASSSPSLRSSASTLQRGELPACLMLRSGSSARCSSRSGSVSLRRTSVAPQCSAGTKKVLIVNTDSGGHAVIGFWAARLMRLAKHEVTVMTVGEEGSDKMKKPPFSRFQELRDIGISTLWGQPSDVGAAVGTGSTFDVVLDNNGKDLETVKPVIDWAKANGATQFLFISSAGIYKSTDQPPHVEGDPVKSDSGHAQVEQYLSQAFPRTWASFRPQYITGSGNNKDCEEWFFDRIVRDRPVPIPTPGNQATVIAHAEDIASMLLLAVANPSAAAGTVFNAVSDRAVTFDGLVRMCARAAGKEAKVVHYDPKKAGVDVKKAFPFRNMHFYSEPRAAKVQLGWECQHDLQEALNARYLDYLAVGRDKKNVRFELDDQILATLG